MPEVGSEAKAIFNVDFPGYKVQNPRCSLQKTRSPSANAKNYKCINLQLQENLALDDPQLERQLPNG